MLGAMRGLLWGGSEPAPTVAGQQPLYAGTPETSSGQGAPIAQGQSSENTVAPGNAAGNAAQFAEEGATSLADRDERSDASLESVKQGLIGVGEGVREAVRGAR
uniref:Uncharacterized protein n=1 Tax=Rhodocyclus tenuis TaxID=1066 RepID=A0A840G3N5_RHOTE|nr:hypothetical protein [Rhodocyclus tenuis]